MANLIALIYNWWHLYTGLFDGAAGFELFATAAAADADPDSDGLPNGAEYILGGNPSATASGGNIILTFPRDDVSETPDVTLTVETGTNLLTWPTVFNIGPNTAASSPGVSIVVNGAAPDTIHRCLPARQSPAHLRPAESDDRSVMERPGNAAVLGRLEFIRDGGTSRHRSRQDVSLREDSKPPEDRGAPRLRHGAAIFS